MKNISIVTGGASGLGKSLTKKLLEKGQSVCIISRNQAKIDAVKNELGADIVSYAGDLSNEAFCKEVFADLNSKGYYVDYLYNNAGIGIFGEPVDMNMEKIMAVMNSNVIGLMCLTYEALRNMQNGGTIVNVMSTAALKTPPKESLYSASKCAVKGFTDSLKQTYKKTNIHIIGVYPGGMNTPFWTPDCGSNPDVSKFMDPDEVADVIVFNTLERKTSYTSDIVIERK